MSDVSGNSIPPKALPQDTQGLPDPAMALRLYREGVEELWKLKSGKAISNGVPEHAAILFTAFFEHAQKHVRIFCQNLSSPVFGDSKLVSAALEALKRNVAIDIILQTEPESSEFKKLLTMPGVRFVVAGKPVSDYDLNFAVMDQIAVRVEPHRGKCEAQAVMYTPDNAKTLSIYFDKLWALVSPVQPKTV